MDFKECNDNDRAEINKWYEQCKEADKPYVLCLNRATQSKVEWDYITLSESKEAALFSMNEQAMMGKLLDIHRRYGNKKSKFYGSVGTGYMDNLSRDNAAEAANEVALLLRAASDSSM